MCFKFPRKFYASDPSILCLIQLVEEPTRGINILDLVLTNNCDLIHSYSVRYLGLSDNSILTVSLLLPSRLYQEPKRENRDRFR